MLAMDLIIFALTVFAAFLLGAWVYHRGRFAKSPLVGVPASQLAKMLGRQRGDAPEPQEQDRQTMQNEKTPPFLRA